MMDWLKRRFRAPGAPGEPGPFPRQYSGFGEEALLRATEESVAWMRLLTDSVPVMISYIDSDLIYRFSSREHARWMARSPEEIVGRPVPEIITPEAWKALEPSLRRVLAGHRVEYTSRLPYEDGKVRDIRVVYVPDLGPDGHVRGLSAMAEDITEIKSKERSLRESELQLSYILENTPVPVFVTRPTDREFLLANRACNEFFLEQPGSMEGRDCYGLWVESEQRPAIMDRIERDGIARDYEVRVFAKGGDIRWVQATTALIHYNGEDAYLTILADITERKDIENRLIGLNEALEQGIRERTRELEAAQQELLAKEKLAILGNLAATVSHELRNPLGTIRNSVPVLAKALAGDNEVVNRVLERINRNVLRCDRIIDEMLNYTRQHKLSLKLVTLDPWLEQVLEEQTLPEGIALERHLDADGVRVRMAPETMRRAVLNLLENAVQAMQDMDAPAGGYGGHCLRVTTQHDEDKVRLRFTDTGPGIPGDLASKIFEPLFSTRNFGVGLGLPIVRKIIEEHDGTLEFHSEPGAGATFTLSLPIA